MLQVLQKEYFFDAIEFSRWQEEVYHRRTLLGMIWYYFGKVVAITFIVRVCLSAKNVVDPTYQTEMIDKVTKFVIEIFTQLLTVLGFKVKAPAHDGDFIGPD